MLKQCLEMKARGFCMHVFLVLAINSINGQRLGPWEKGDKNPPWGGGCGLQSANIYYFNVFYFLDKKA